MNDEITITGYAPGAIGRVVELHAHYYAEHWGFDAAFEAKVAAGLGEFFGRMNPAVDGFWLARRGREPVGSVTIDGGDWREEGARLRWFIVGEAARGRGVGKALMQEAMQFCRRAGHTRVYLWTFAGLDAARRLYERHGFRLVEEHEGTEWGKPMREQRMVADLATA
ncbi:MAG: GNAT family N-acetyltransferase [Burkholderiales bacterium]|nr:GNAT family N-acetyltransferase [Burkholderiales bacterium]